MLRPYAIIAILAGMLLPALATAQKKAKVQIARTEMNNLSGAIQQYFATYNRMPVSPNIRALVNNATPDFTFGSKDAQLAGGNVPISPTASAPAMPGATPYYSNRQLIATLRDQSYFGDGTTQTDNGIQHALNPNRVVFYNVKDVKGIGPNGVGSDGVYRDPWGNPYMITVDLNYDNRARDAIYKWNAVSSDPNKPTGSSCGLTKLPDANGVFQNNTFEANATVMIWSMGPDHQFDIGVNAATKGGVNADNILSWK